jgi:hypothetical protein
MARDVENIDFSMKMGNMPLTEEDNPRLKVCLNGNKDLADAEMLENASLYCNILQLKFA